MDKAHLKEILLDQKDAFNSKRNLIQRTISLDKYINTSQVVIVSGVRRCGKSSLLFLIKEAMKLEASEFCYFNFDDERIISDVSILDEIFNLHIELYGKEPILFLDEIQNITNWEKFINRKYEQGTKIFVTGSNAKLLSSEISTSLTGRNKLIELYPFSFSEYLLFKGKSYDPDRLTGKMKSLLQKDFNAYMQTGGFPLVVKENDTELVNGYFQDILYRDIVSRYRLSQVNELKQIGLYLASNIGKLFSYSTLQAISGVKSLSSVKDFLSYYELTYLFSYLKKFDYSVKKQIMNSRKVYTVDHVFATRLGFNFSENKGRLLENIVYMELLRRGCEVYYFSGKHECDFVIKKNLHLVEAIQVVDQLDKTNYEREFRGLQEALQTHQIPQGLLITNSIEPYAYPEQKGITIVSVWKWLLSA